GRAGGTAETDSSATVFGPDQWREFLTPDPRAPIPEGIEGSQEEALRKKLDLYQRLFTATNLGSSGLALANREAGNMLQGIVIFSDGHSTEGSVQDFRSLVELCKSKNIPLFVVGVGEDRPKIKIDITDLRVPEQARPEDHFRVSVDVNGEGLVDREIQVYLDVYKPSGEKAGPALRPKLPVKIKPGEPPHAQAEFELEPGMFNPPAEGKKPEWAEGEWKFIARVPRDKREIFTQPEHVTEPAVMRVVKRPLRILLFAGGTMRDYQFLRTLLYRETQKNRVELSIYLQPPPRQTDRRKGIVQDVDPERLLTRFPDELRDDAEVKSEDKLYNLSGYDVIVAFDPDWTLLRPDQLSKLHTWVEKQGGGLILVAGPVNTVQLA